MTESPERALLLVDAQSRGVESLRESLRKALTRLLRELSADGFYGPGVANPVREAAALSRTAQDAAAGLTWQYLDSLGNVARGSVDLPKRPRGIDPLIVWERPIKAYRYQRSLGVEHEAAVDAAVNRATSIAEDDVTLAVRKSAAQHSIKAPGVTGLRRVIHPELSKGGTCGLCIAASERIYHPGELLPIHGGCNCTVSEVTAADDVGSSLNNLSLGDLYEASGGTSAAELKRTRYQVNEHGELGPVLTPKGRNVRTAADVKADRGVRMDPAEKARKQLAVIEKSISALEVRAAAGEDVSVPLTYQRGLRDRLAAKAAA